MSSSDDAPESGVLLRWTGEDLVFRGRAAGAPEIVVDGDNTAGASPMRLLLLSVAGCMAIDVVMILEKSRVPVESLEVEVDGERAETPPRRYRSLSLVYRVEGPGPEHQDKLQRAVDLSRDTYCSVLHSLRDDLELDIRIVRA